MEDTFCEHPKVETLADLPFRLHVKAICYANRNLTDGFIPTVAARAMGAPEWRIVLRHMLPNTLSPVIVAVVFAIPLAIFAEAVLGFIGFGLPPPTASLGRLINDGYAYLRINIWLVIFPAAVIGLLMLCFTFLGDGLRDALDPRSR